MAEQRAVIVHHGRASARASARLAVDCAVLRAEALLVARSLGDQLSHNIAAFSRQHSLRQPWELEKEDVPALLQLPPFLELAAAWHGMGHIHNDKLLKRTLLQDREHPSDDRTPVVGKESDLAGAACIDQVGHILRQVIERIIAHTLRPVSRAITAKIGCPDAVSLLHEQRDLVPPRIVQLRKAMKHQGQVIALSCFCDLKCQAIGFNKFDSDAAVRWRVPARTARAHSPPRETPQVPTSGNRPAASRAAAAARGRSVAITSTPPSPSSA